MFEGDILIVTYRLAVLTFYIGVLIYALPIPWRPLKKWAPTLIIDGLVAAGMAAGFYAILGASDKIAHALGGSWQMFEQWYSAVLGFVIGVKTMIFYIETVLAPFGLADVLDKLFNPLNKVADSAIVVIAWITVLYIIVTYFGKALAAIGIALMAVPFRVSRSAGAWMLSFILVFNAGLQVMPSFISQLAEAPGGPDPSRLETLGLAIANVAIVDWGGRPVKGGLVHLMVEDEEVARYKVSGGYVWDDQFGSYIPIPSRTPSGYILEVDDVYFHMEPYPTPTYYYDSEGSLWVATLSNDYLLWIDDGYVIAYTNGGFYSHTVNNGSHVINVYLDEGEYIAVRSPVTCTVNLVSSGLELETFTWSWKGVDGLGWKLVADSSGSYNVTVQVVECGSVIPDLGSTTNYIESVASIEDYAEWNLITAILLYYVTIPLFYVFILFSVTFGLARFLGGRDRFPIKV